MYKLIIQFDNETISHVMDDKAAVIGRDVECDLVFPDDSLSRCHTRFELTPAGILLVDLGSRNGSWVNNKKVEKAYLTSADTVRIGTLHIEIEGEPPTSPKAEKGDYPLAGSVLPADEEEEEKTDPLLRKEPPPQDKGSKTRVLSRDMLREALMATPPDAEPSTAQPPAEDDETTEPSLRLEPPPQGKGSRTRVLSRDMLREVLMTKPPAAEPSVEQPPAEDDEITEPNLRLEPPPQGKGSKTRVLSRDMLREVLMAKPPAAEPSVEQPPAKDDEITAQPEKHGLMDRIASWSWAFKFFLLVSCLGGVIYFFLAWPLLHTLGNELRQESLLRGRALLNLFAATSGPLVGQDRFQELTVNSVIREERVKEAVLLDLSGRVLAPPARTDETMETVEGIGLKTQDIRTFYLGRKSGDEYVMVLPLHYQGDRVGVAVIVYEAATAAGGWALAVLFLAFLVLLMGVALTVRLGKRLTLMPIISLRDDVEAVVKGDAMHIPPEQAFEELSGLAESVNRLIDRASRPGTSVKTRQPTATEPQPVSEPVNKANSVPSPSISSHLVPPLPGPESDGVPPLSKSSPGAPPATPAVGTGDPDCRPPARAPEKLGTAIKAEFCVDERYIISRVDDTVHDLVGCAPGEMEGKHLIEAIKDLRVLEVILDAINAIDQAPRSTAKAESANGPLEVSAAREGTSVVVCLMKL